MCYRLERLQAFQLAFQLQNLTTLTYLRLIRLEILFVIITTTFHFLLG